MIALNSDQKTKLLSVIEVMPVGDDIKKHWTESVNAEHTPKHVLFDIAMTMEAVEESKGKMAQKDKVITDFFSELHSDLKQNDTAIDTKLTNIEKEVMGLEQEFKAKEEPTATPANTNQPQTNNTPPPDATI